jgi:predicted lipoprotein with Yx(FWY)xxD motif
MKKTALSFILLVVIATIVIAGCMQQQQVQPTPQPATTVQPADTIRVADTSLGKVLVDAQGKTLYYFANDIPSSGNSSCYGQCSAIWPTFSTDPVRVSSPLDPADFASITRTDGSKQITYSGWPLYYYASDTKPGDLNGENVLKVWFVVKPDESVLIAHKADLGLYLTDTSGKTLYYFTRDTSGQSACTGACITLWPPFNADTVTAPSVLKPADFGPVSRPDGLKQTAYMGRPLYFFSNDAKPGDIKGQGFNNLWFVANISGNIPVVTTLPTAVPTAQPTTQKTLSYYGGGY